MAVPSDEVVTPQAENLPASTPQPQPTDNPTAIRARVNPSHPEDGAFWIAVALATLVAIGALFYTDHCARVLANEIHHTVYWFPYLSCVIAFLGVGSQGVLCYMIMWYPLLQQPLLRRYRSEGREITGYTVDRYVVKDTQQEQQRGWCRRRRQRHNKPSHKVYKVVVAYRPPTSYYQSAQVYAKEFRVPEQEYQASQFPLVILPNLPTSAVLSRELQDQECGSTKCVIEALFGLFAPLLWLLVGVCTFNSLPDGDIWCFTCKGLAGMAAISIVSAFLGSYCTHSKLQWDMLEGGADEIPVTWLPESLAEWGQGQETIDEDASDDVETSTASREETCFHMVQAERSTMPAPQRIDRLEPPAEC